MKSCFQDVVNVVYFRRIVEHATDLVGSNTSVKGSCSIQTGMDFFPPPLTCTSCLISD